MTTVQTDDRLNELYDFFQNAPIGVQILDPDGGIRLANDAQLTIERSLRPVVVHSNATLCVTFLEPETGTRDAPQASRDVAGELATMPELERGDLLDLLTDAFENAPVALHIVGPDGLIRHANRLELENLGYEDEPDAYIGHHIAEFHAEQAVIDDMLERLVGGRPLVHYRATLVCRNGETKPVVIYSSPRFERGEFVNTRCFTFPKSVDTAPDVPTFGWPRQDDEGDAADETSPLTTALKRLAGRKQAEESLGFLAETSKALAAAERYADGADAVCRLAVPFLADWCSVEVEERPLAVARGDGITGSDELVRSSSAREGAADVACAPFVTRDGAHGALLLARAGGRPAFGPPDVALAEEVARRIAAAIEAGQLRERIAAGGSREEAHLHVDEGPDRERVRALHD